MGKDPEESLAQQLATKYLPFWPLFLIATIVALGAAFVYLRYATPVYEANATLIIKDEKKGNEESKLMESLDQISSKKIVENEIEVLQSRKLMDSVVNKLGLYAPIYAQGDLKATTAYLSSPVVVLSAAPDSLKKAEKIKLYFDEKNNEVILNDTFRYPMNEPVVTAFGKLEFVPNKHYQQPEKPVKQFYFSLINPRDLVPGLLGSLKAEASSKLSSIINLSFKDESPKRAEDILNQMIASYRQSEINEKNALAKNTLAFVEERLNIVAQDLDSIEKKVQQFKSGRNAVDISKQGTLFLENVSSNDQKLSEVNTQISVLNQVENFVKNKENTGGIVPSTLGVSDPMLSQLLDKLYTSELEYEKLKKTVGENNPSLVSIQDQINKIKPNILQNIQSQQRGLNAVKQNLQSTNSGYSSMLQAVPQKERQLLDITREQQMKSAVYASLLQKREESELAYASTVSNNRIVDDAQAGPNPVSPKKALVYLVALALFLGTCIAVITVRESLTGKILYRNEIEARTSIPIIGEVAFDKSKNPIVIESGRRSFIAEEFRTLRISLSSVGIDDANKKILIASSISGEGKSFIATNLAISLGLTGKRVALVDMDLNNPSIAKMLQVESGQGVTEFLTGKKEASEIIKEVAEHENLFFVSAGDLPNNPTELLSKGRVKQLIDYLDSSFDMVVIDTSPMAVVTDGYLLTGLCNATLYVVRHNYTPKMMIKRLNLRNNVNPINNPAIIFNGVKMRGFFKAKYGYGYGYDYVYRGNYGGGKTKKEKKTMMKS